FVLPGGPGLLGQGLPLAPAVQPSLAQTIAVQNPSNEESGLGNQNSGFQTSRDLASPEFRESRFETALGDEEAWASEDGAIQDLGQYEREHSQSLLASNQPALRPQFGSGLRKFLKPIRFQKSPFSTRLQTEEGLHLGFLVLVLALAFVLGRKLHTSKKLPRVIPEIVLSSEKQSRGQSLAVRRRPRQG
ncbi:hypothetical protein EBT16_05150, partial [bacterium]|nr:hypothetical protein [bacterium]